MTDTPVTGAMKKAVRDALPDIPGDILDYALNVGFAASPESEVEKELREKLRDAEAHFDSECLSNESLLRYIEELKAQLAERDGQLVALRDALSIIRADANAGACGDPVICSNCGVIEAVADHTLTSTEAPAREAVEGIKREAFEEAAKIAEYAHMVPPDGGSPTDGECDVAVNAAAQIRALAGGE